MFKLNFQRVPISPTLIKTGVLNEDCLVKTVEEEPGIKMFFV